MGDALLCQLGKNLEWIENWLIILVLECSADGIVYKDSVLCKTFVLILILGKFV